MKYQKNLSQHRLVLILTFLFSIFSTSVTNILNPNFEIKPASKLQNAISRFKRNEPLPKLPQSSHDASQFFKTKITTESSLIHEHFLLALRASKSLPLNKTNSKKLRLQAPPQFCPFNRDIACQISNKYRQIDGSCNNLINRQLGKTSTPFKRLLTPAYEDKLNEPRRLATNGEPLANPRNIATIVHDPLEVSSRITHLGVMIGQFVDHDFALSAASPGSDGNQLKCTCDSTDTNCINIQTPNDSMFPEQKCMILTRSSSSFDKFDCVLSAREQLNLVSTFLDLSQLYGTELAQHNKLRSFSNGRLKSSRISGFRFDHLPFANPGVCVEETSERLCFESGDERTSQNLLLVSIHTVWLREHNRLSKALRKLNPTWDDETLYQEARRINIAQYQHILYSEWLPALLGNKIANENDLSVQSDAFFMRYDQDTNPSLASEFSTVAFRFGHSMSRSSLSKCDKSLNSFDNITLTSIMFRPIEAYTNGGLDSICRGLLVDPANKFDSHLTSVLQDHLFETNAFNVPTNHFSLSAINIMRGRDHGIPSYNEFRKLANLTTARIFKDMKEIPIETRRNLRKVYKSVNDIDAFTGGTAEAPFDDSVLGPTFTKIVAQQFRDLKFGDRFYYENGDNPVTRFSLNQLNQIRRTSVSRIMCDNLDILSAQLNGFILSGNDNPRIKCRDFKSVDLSFWKDEPVAVNRNPNQDQISDDS